MLDGLGNDFRPGSLLQSSFQAKDVFSVHGWSRHVHHGMRFKVLEGSYALDETRNIPRSSCWRSETVSGTGAFWTFWATVSTVGCVWASSATIMVAQVASRIIFDSISFDW
jgi:hypothetical protein